ncbi:ATP-dependent DNA helicase II [Phlyctema vagabunda]|uniref:ATP-dependent DNA helicase II subunit 1 n=1 Tax=Phlyctema vagabunda TaxID=108571 RepID=A0ABR4PUA4_9HELO
MAENDSWRRDGDEEEEEDELDENDYRAQKDAVLFAIEINPSMLTQPSPSEDKKADQDSPASAALKCAYQIMQQRIISNPKDMMGVILFGTEQSRFQDEHDSRGTISYPHCYLLNDLDVPSAEDVKALQNIVEDEEEANSLLEPAEEPMAMANLLFCANQIFTTKAPNFGSRRLFIITDNDNPHPDDKNAGSSAAVRAKDLYDLGVVIELFPISKPDHGFDLSKFYDDIIYRDQSQTDSQVLGLTDHQDHKSGGDGISLLNSLILDINSKQVAKRALFSEMPLEIGPGFKISVKGYNILQKQVAARSTYVHVDGEQAQIVKGETLQVADGSLDTVEKFQIKKAYKFGGEQVLFKPEEQKELKNFGPPGIRIIGFKPQSMLPSWASMNKSTFIFPSEDGWVGSTRTFAALWQKLRKDEKMGLAWYIARSNATPILVAILPSTEKIDAVSGGQIIPGGLWLYPLPFADDIRNPPDTLKPLVSPDNLIDAMRIIVQQLQLPKAEYDPSKYPNPALQWHYKILQAMALEEEVPTIPEDKTVPKYRQIHKRVGEYAMDWARILDEQTRSQQRRGRDDDEQEGGSSVGPPRKKIKTESKDDTLVTKDQQALKKLVANGQLSKHTVPDLKAFCSAKGISSSGKKGDIVERVEDWIESH